MKSTYLCMRASIHPSGYRYRYLGFCEFFSPAPIFPKTYSSSFSCSVDPWKPHIQASTVNWLMFWFNENPWCEPGEQKEERRHSIFLSPSVSVLVVSLAVV